MSSTTQLLNRLNNVNIENLSDSEVIKEFKNFLSDFNNHQSIRPEQKHTEVISNPVTGWNYKGIGSEYVNWKDLPKIMNYQAYLKWKYPMTKEEIQKRINDNDPYREQSFYSNEYLGKFQDEMSKMEDALSSRNSYNNPVYASGYPGLITDTNHPELRINNTISEFINFSVRQNPLDLVIPNAPSDTLQEKIYELEGFEVFPNSVDGAVAPPQVGKLTETKFDIGQDIGSIGITLRGQLVYKNSPLDIESVYAKHMSEKLQLAKNQRIMTETINKFTTTVAGETFDTRSTVGISDKDPHKTFNNLILELQNAGGQSLDGKLSTCISNLLVFNALESNDHFPKDATKLPMGNGVFNISAYSSDFRWAVIDLIPSTDKFFYALSEKAAKLWNGITRAYEITQLNGDKIKHVIQFNSSHALKTSYGRKVTGVLA